MSQNTSEAWSTADQLDSMFGVPQPTLPGFQAASVDPISELLHVIPQDTPSNQAVWPVHEPAEPMASPPISPRPSGPPVDYSDIFPKEVWKDVTGSNKLPTSTTSTMDATKSSASDATNANQLESVQEKFKSSWPFESSKVSSPNQGPIDLISPPAPSIPGPAGDFQTTLGPILNHHNISLKKAVGILIDEYMASLSTNLRENQHSSKDEAKVENIDEIMGVIRDLEAKNKELTEEVSRLRAENERLRLGFHSSHSPSESSLSSKLKNMLGV